MYNIFNKKTKEIIESFRDEDDAYIELYRLDNNDYDLEFIEDDYDEDDEYERQQDFLEQ